MRQTLSLRSYRAYAASLASDVRWDTDHLRPWLDICVPAHRWREFGTGNLAFTPLTKQEADMYWDIVAGIRKQFEVEAQAQWEKLTENHLRTISGRGEKQPGKLQEAYGIGEDEAAEQIQRFEDGYSAKSYRHTFSDIGMKNHTPCADIPASVQCHPVCPRCKGPVMRVPRRWRDLLISLLAPCRRYRCNSAWCNWCGTLPAAPSRARATDKALRQSK